MLAFRPPAAWAQEPAFTVVAYNVENLFDVDGVALFEQYQADQYRPHHLLRKLVNITRVVQSIVSDVALRSAEHLGQIFFFSGVVSAEKPFRARLFDQDYKLWSFDRQLRINLRRLSGGFTDQVLRRTRYPPGPLTVLDPRPIVAAALRVSQVVERRDTPVRD